MKQPVRFAFVFVLALALALAAVGVAGAITNGQPDGNAHPYVGLIVFDDEDGPAWRCSGSLLSPTLVLTAGHCTDGAVAARVWFDEVVQGNPEYPFSGATSYDGMPHTNPDYCIICGPGNSLPGFINRDVGVVTLSEPVPAAVVDRYAQLPAAGAVDALRNKALIDLVGYGVQEQAHGGGPPVWTGPRVRLFAQAEFISGKFVHSGEFMRVSGNAAQGKGGTCFGDSGGPNLAADTDTVLGVTSYGADSNCAAPGYASRVDIPAVLDWINSFD